MSVIVKGLKMPESCGECRDSGDLRWLCTAKRVNGDDYANFPPPDCPLDELPTPHGRLIDADVAQQKLEELCKEYKISYGISYGGFAEKLFKLFDNIPTIIEAEVSEE